MKAAVLHRFGEAPRYEDIPVPVPSAGQLLMQVKAASVKNLDKLRASGTHYASYAQLPAIVGIDAVGVLPDGTRVYAQGLDGTIAEQALIREAGFIPLPDGLDDVLAAALPNAVIGAAMALHARARMQPGETVLVNGATGVTGRLAVQIARHYGAGKIIVTGRNEQVLESLRNDGADEIISLKQDDAAIIAQLKASHQERPIDIVLDYLWGRPVELIIASLKGGGIHHVSSRVRIVTVGSMAGEDLHITSGTLRSSAIELLGSGLGSLSAADLQDYHNNILPEMFRLAAAGRLTMQTETAPLEDIAVAWDKETAPGQRLVITV